MKSTLDDEKLKDKISESDKETITKKCDEITNWLRLMSLQTSKRKWKAFAIQSSLSYTNKQVEHQEVCPVVCQEVCPEACPAVCQEELEVLQVPVVPEDQPSKRSIKQQNVFCPVNYLSNKMHTNNCSTNDVIACC